MLHKKQKWKLSQVGALFANYTPLLVSSVTFSFITVIVLISTGFFTIPMLPTPIQPDNGDNNR